MAKVWVKAGTYDAGSRSNFCQSTDLRNESIEFVLTGEDNREKGKLYKPQSRHEEKSSSERSYDYTKSFSAGSTSGGSARKESSSSSSKKIPKSQEKKKSNLELFKEELRQ